MLQPPSSFWTEAARSSRFMSAIGKAADACTACLRASGKIMLAGNGGVYVLRREIIDLLRAPCSLEHDVFPRLAVDGRLTGEACDRSFIDIEVPSSYAEAQTFVPSHRRRPAVFLDRDGGLNEDFGDVGTKERLVLRPGAIAMVKRFNDAEYFVFLVTNQACVAKGFYDENAMRALTPSWPRILRNARHTSTTSAITFSTRRNSLGLPIYSPWRNPKTACCSTS